MAAHFNKMKLCFKLDQVSVQHKTDLELFPQLRGITLGIDPQHLFVGDGELVHQDGRLSAQTGLQNSIVDKDILLL